MRKSLGHPHSLQEETYTTNLIYENSWKPCTIESSGSVTYVELNRHSGTAPSRFHVHSDDVRPWIIDKLHGMSPIDVSHPYPRDSRIVTRITEVLCRPMWQPSRWHRRVLGHATDWVILCWVFRSWEYRWQYR